MTPKETPGVSTAILSSMSALFLKQNQQEEWIFPRQYFFETVVGISGDNNAGLHALTQRLFDNKSDGLYKFKGLDMKL